MRFVTQQLFNSYSKTMYKKAIQLDIFQAREERDKGIAIATNHAESLDPGWQQRAYEILLKFLDSHDGEFMAEEVRSFAAVLDFVAPGSNRVWGSLIVRARKEGLITQVGYRKVRNPRAHMANSAVWKKV